MSTELSRYRWLLGPGFAGIFFILWIVAEAGRLIGAPWPTLVVPLGFLAAAIGVARRFPWLALGLIGAELSMQVMVPSTRFTSTSWPIYLAVLITCLIISATATGRVRRISLPITAVYAVVIASLMTIPFLSDGYGWTSWIGVRLTTSNIVGSFVQILLASLGLTAGAWFIGFGFRASQQKRDSEAKLDATVGELQSAEIDLIVARERDRIAQDVHDIMAHSLAVIIAQADGARFIGPTRPEAVNESLERIAASARVSLSEVRMLIESLVEDPDGHSNPTLENLEDLVERMEGAGLSIRMKQFGEPATLTASQQLAVYRIVQESLTNALKHAGSHPTARVMMDWRGPGLAITIDSSGDPQRPPSSDTSSSKRCRGIYGMRERARLAGGWLTAGIDEDSPGGFLVTAFVPTLEVESAAAPERGSSSQ